MRKFRKYLILVLLALIIAVFAVANRHMVTVTLDPFATADQPSALVYSLPLFALAFILLIIGAIVGGIATWFGQHKWRRAARAREAEIRALRAEAEDLKRRLAAVEAPPRTAEPRVALRPPAA
jgi:Mn2+/Fe2+ NRAMP family transporter